MERPLPGYSFFVTLDPADAYLPAAQAALVPYVAVGAFKEVRGLGAELETMTQAEGGLGDTVHILPVRHSWTRITLRRGIVRDSSLFTWYQAGLRQSLGARRDGAIVLLTAGGAPAMSWTFRTGLAVKWNGPELDATQNSVALESLEIAHEGIEQHVLSAAEPD